MSSLQEAEDICLQLQLIVTNVRESLEKRAKDSKQPVVLIEKKGTEIQNDALKLCCIMRAKPPTPQSMKEILQVVISNKDNEEIKQFLTFWEKLGNVSGVYKLDNETPKTLFGDWYLYAPCNFMPTKVTLHGNEETDKVISKYVIEGWAPLKPFISKEKLVTALGSCFADEVLVYLKQREYKITSTEHGWRTGGNLPIISCAAGLVNTFVILQQFEWALEAKNFGDDLWFGSKGDITHPTEEMRLETRTIFLNTKIFIVTLGLSEIWCRQDTGQVLWRAVPKEHYDPKIHKFRVSTTQENVQNLEKMIKLIKEHVPDSSIILTLSPVPLRATFRPVSCITANSVSKSILRVAIDEVMQNHRGDDKLFYWPSYEIVKEFHTDPYMDDGRHIKPEIVAQIMRLFHENYLLE